jgi:hypothetical protein
MSEHDHNHDQTHIKNLLQQALPPVAAGAEPTRDLWPAVLRKLDAKPASPPWFDWALAGSLLALIAFFPASIPVFLYFL